MTGQAEPRQGGTGERGYVIRRLTTDEELVACLALQREVWGEDFQDCVAPALLKVSGRVGGIVAGAVDEGGRVVGFVFGITGVVEGRLVHWSHMLGVHPAARGAGLGRRLKEFQRKAAAELGADRIYWSFDPLVSRNAHLNLNLLGAEVAEYVPNMYPPMASKLHGRIPLDRLVVSWRTDGRNGRGPGGTTGGDGAGGPVVLDWRATIGSDGRLDDQVAAASVVRIPVPSDFDQLVQSSPSAALEIRERTREFFVCALDRGFGVVGFDRGRDGDPHYTLVRDRTS